MSNQLHTFVGNVVADPELRQTPNDIPVLQMRIAVDDRYYDTKNSEWQSRPSQFWTVQVWRELAEQVAAGVKRGDQVIVVGEFRTETWTDNGQPRSRTYLLGTHIGLDLARRPSQQGSAASNGQAVAGADDPGAERADWNAE
jgi:single-strand DNA-binding protein